MSTFTITVEEAIKCLPFKLSSDVELIYKENSTAFVLKPKTILKEHDYYIKGKEFHNSDDVDLNASLLADLVADQLEKRIAFRRAIREALQRAQKQNVNGIKIQV